MDPQLVAVLSAIGGSGGLFYALRQLRLYLEYRQRMKLARYVFDHTRSTDGLAGLASLAKAERPTIRYKSPDLQNGPSTGGLG